VLIPTRHELAEGPVWHAGALWWVDINAGLLMRLDPDDNSLHARATGDVLGAAVPTSRPGFWLLARRDHLALLDWTSGRMTPWSSPDASFEQFRFNDGKCDPAGRFFAGTLDLSAAGRACSLFAFAPNSAPQLIDDDLLLSNGLAWTHTGTRLHHIDTLHRTLVTRPYDPATGHVGPGEHSVKFHESWGLPDGMAADCQDGLWIAFWGGSCVRRIDPESGTESARIDLPVTQPSSVCFGGEKLDQLFITTARQGLTSAQQAAQPRAGAVFVARPGVVGQPIPQFQLP